MKNFLLSSEYCSDGYSTTYEAYDKKKKCWCFLTIPTKPTSWEFSVEY